LGGQIKHPRIRGALSPSHEQKRFIRNDARLEDLKTDEETYFVPSFSIRRHLHSDEALLWQTQQNLIKRRLGKGFTVTPAENITLKVIEQQKLIRNMRQAGIHPDPYELLDVAYTIRNRLSDLLSNAQSPLRVPLGDINRHGYREESIAYDIKGWRGERATYPSDDGHNLGTHAVLLKGRQIVTEVLDDAYGDQGLETNNLTSSPHVTFARSNANKPIPDYRMRSIRGGLGDLAIAEADFGDPVIDVKMYPDMPAERIYVKYAWDSLATAAGGIAVAETVLDTDYDRYEDFAELTQYA
jgi:hypothetical protein